MAMPLSLVSLSESTHPILVILAMVSADSHMIHVFVYAATIFISSVHLFLVQPIIAKQILPWFGGTASAVFLQFNAAKLPKICETSLRDQNQDLVGDLTLILSGVCVRFCGENFCI
jgi:uncharacterized integral membrane protein